MVNIGSKRQVMNGTKHCTAGGLKKCDIKKKNGRYVYKKKSKPVGKLSKNQFICLACNRTRGKVKKVTGENIMEHNGRVPYLSAECPKCGGQLRKYIKA
jgi:hypothetical protein